MKTKLPALAPLPERVPIAWNHAIEKDSLKIKKLGHVRIGKPLRTFPALAFALLMGVGAMTPATAQIRLGGPGNHPHFCPTGTSWQPGCLKWAPAGPGQLFGACTQQGWSCKRAPQPIQ